MEKDELAVIAQLLNAMNEACDKLSDAYKKGDMQDLAAARKEIMRIQEEINSRI